MKCKAAMVNLLKIRAARKFLTRKACTKMVISLVISCLDYANSLLVGLPQVSLNQFQRVQNMAAKIVLNRGKYDNSTRCLDELHWLPIQQRITFKILTFTFKCIHGQAPSYLEKPITIKTVKKRRNEIRKTN